MPTHVFHLRKTKLLILFTVTSSLFLHAQNIEPLDSLLRQIIRINKKAATEQIGLLLQYKEKTLLNILPSIGYDVITNRPLVNFSFNNYIALNQRKKDLKYQLSQINIKSRMQLIADTLTCASYYKEIKEMIENYQNYLLLLNNSKQLLSIKITENINLQTSSEELLKLELEMEKSRMEENQLRTQIIAKALQISLLIQRPLRYQLP